VNGEADADTGGLIRQPRSGDLAALGRLLDTYRNYLTLLARLHIGPLLQGKISASDVVQATCLQAHRSIRQFRGSTEAELLAWLRSIHASKLDSATFDRLTIDIRDMTPTRRQSITSLPYEEEG
jgi:RNA polymerase sigma-70 factor (ECF subfamily)